ncbi:MAG: site-2 protease family protein [Candidatus Micrarchaeia archaeon]
MMRVNISFMEELRELLLADIVLTFAFAAVIIGGVFGTGNASGMSFVYVLPMAFVAVSLTFVLHELMHKFVAERYGAIAAFRASRTGLIITLASGFFGFLIGIPGATVIYANNFTKKENGLVSIAGPLTNFAIFGLFFVIMMFVNPKSYIGELASLTMFISIILAFFNMLPIYPLDGSKVLLWNPAVYGITMLVIFTLLIYVAGWGMLFDIMFMFIIALLFSMSYRRLF